MVDVILHRKLKLSNTNSTTNPGPPRETGKMWESGSKHHNPNPHLVRILYIKLNVQCMVEVYNYCETFIYYYG